MLKITETKFSLEKASVGQTLPPFRVHVETKIYRRYNRIIKEINPIHFNKNYAQKLGYEDIVVAGNFLFTYIPKWILDWIQDVEAIQKVTIKFENPVYINEEIIHNGKIIDIKDESDKKIIICEYYVEKPDGLRTSFGQVILSFKK